MIGIAALGSVQDINCWSNIPYFFFKQGFEDGIFNDPWNLDLSDFGVSRKYWNLLNLLCFNKPGGYQYSASFLNKAESLIPAHYFSQTIISFNQVFPRAETVKSAGGKIIYYIDMTLTDLFLDPSYNVKIGHKMKRVAIEQETKNYKLADMVITMGRWPIETLRTNYGMSETKLGHIRPGANLFLKSGWKGSSFKHGAGLDRELVLGFIGKDWERKGLGILIEIKRELHRRGFKVKLKIIGNCPIEWQHELGVEFLGLINKMVEADKFVNEIATCDIGCLFSKGEALGISVLEFLAVGVPVAGFFHQGLKDTLLPGASIRFMLDESIVTISDKFQEFITDSNYQHNLKTRAEELSSTVTWKSCIDSWSKTLKVNL